MATVALAALCLSVGRAAAQSSPVSLSALPDGQSVYEPQTPATEDAGINAGGVKFSLDLTYATNHVYRGIDYNKVAERKKALNFQADTALSFDLGKFPHPFVGVFSNVYNADPTSRFQEIRPYFGMEMKLKPFIAAAGHNSYIYPEREKFNTSEVWARLTLDDSYIFKSDQPFLSPYIYGAYDYDLNKGWYLEAGVHHDFVIEDTGLTITVTGDVAYFVDMKQQFIFIFDQIAGLKHTGFQHYDVGLKASYSLNRLFKVSTRFGDWTLVGFITYTGAFDKKRLFADNTTWGGVGIGFKY